MKRVFSIILSIYLMVSLSVVMMSCADDDVVKDDSDTKAVVDTTAQDTTAESDTEAQTEAPDAGNNGSGNGNGGGSGGSGNGGTGGSGNGGTGGGSSSDNPLTTKDDTNTDYGEFKPAPQPQN